jgi:two-component sensor histidine kinase
MAMVHEMLYKRDDYLSKIELKPYIEELCEYLIRSIKGSTDTIELKLDIAEIKLSIDTVIPLGLIINETVTNALKYGFPEDKKGEILIRLGDSNNNKYELYLGDNGIGFPEDVNPKNSKSLGLKLIHNLSRQLRGTIERDLATKGTYYRIIFEEIIEEFNSVD